MTQHCMYSLILSALFFMACNSALSPNSETPLSTTNDTIEDTKSSPSGDTANSDNITVSEALGSFLCTPPGDGPFPGVLYNHGGLGSAVGGDLEATCKALAVAGYVGHSKKRRETVPLTGHMDDLYEGLNTLKAHPKTDVTRIGMVGFSRGGLLSLVAAVEKPDDFKCVVLMAPAAANGALDKTLEKTDQIQAPVLILVSENDLFQDDHVALAEKVEASLAAEKKDVKLKIYPPFDNDGHTRFFEVGDYWKDILSFMEPHL